MVIYNDYYTRSVMSTLIITKIVGQNPVHFNMIVEKTHQCTGLSGFLKDLTGFYRIWKDLVEIFQKYCKNGGNLA